MIQSLQPDTTITATENYGLPEPETSHQQNKSTDPPKNWPRRMRVLFSGCGKAEEDMGMAPIPAMWNPGPPKWWS